MDWKSKVRLAMQSQQVIYKKLFALEINKSQWLETDELYQATQTQQASAALMAQLVPVEKLVAGVDTSVVDSVSVVRSDRELAGVYDDLRCAVEKLHNLCERNQKILKAKMQDVLQKINEMSIGRKALKGYHSQTKAGPQRLDGSL